MRDLFTFLGGIIFLVVSVVVGVELYGGDIAERTVFILGKIMSGYYFGHGF